MAWLFVFRVLLFFPRNLRCTRFCNITAFGKSRKLPNGLASTSDCGSQGFLNNHHVAQNRTEPPVKPNNPPTWRLHLQGRENPSSSSNPNSSILRICPRKPTIHHQHASTHRDKPEPLINNPPTRPQPCPSQSPNPYRQAKIRAANVR